MDLHEFKSMLQNITCILVEVHWNLHKAKSNPDLCWSVDIVFCFTNPQSFRVERLQVCTPYFVVSLLTRGLYLILVDLLSCLHFLCAGMIKSFWVVCGTGPIVHHICLSPREQWWGYQLWQFYAAITKFLLT